MAAACLASVVAFGSGGAWGQYVVDYGRDVSSCVWVAGISSVTAPTTEGQAQVGPRNGNAEAIFVLTTNSAGTIVDKPFHVIVVC